MLIFRIIVNIWSMRTSHWEVKVRNDGTRIIIRNVMCTKTFYNFRIHNFTRTKIHYCIISWLQTHTTLHWNQFAKFHFYDFMISQLRDFAFSISCSQFPMICQNDIPYELYEILYLFFSFMHAYAVRCQSGHILRTREAGKLSMCRCLVLCTWHMLFLLLQSHSINPNINYPLP